MALEGTVKVPGIGPVKKQTAVYGGVAAVALVLVIWWARQRSASQAAASSAAAAAPAAAGQTDPAGNTGTIDPATGFVYGSPEDQQALAAAQGATAAYDTSALGGGGLSGYYYGSGGSVPATAPGPGNFADNAEWAQYVEAYMTGTLNADPASAGNAIGKYLTGQPLDSTQQNIVHEAIAYGGQPPQSGSGGYPPGIRTATSGSGGGSAKGSATVPKVTGETAGTAHDKIVAAGLTPIADPQQQPNWVVTSTSPKGGASAAKGTRVLITAHAPASRPKSKPPRKEPT